MNADERRPGMVAQCAKVDGAILEDKPALRAGPSGASKAPRGPLPALIRVLFIDWIAPVRSTNRFERFTKSSLRLCRRSLTVCRVEKRRAWNVGVP